MALIVLIGSGCGGPRPPEGVNGPWSAQLAFPDGRPAYSFSAMFAQGSGSNVEVSNFSFSPPSNCTFTPNAASATFSATGASNGFQTGPFGMTIFSTFGTQAMLTLSGGRENSGWIFGSWKLTAVSGCPIQGTFVMKRPPTT